MHTTHLSCLAALVTATVLAAQAADEWPQFRGPTGQGVSDARDLPTAWSETNNIVWKTELPGTGFSRPDRNSIEGLPTSRSPWPSIAKTPISLTAP